MAWTYEAAPDLSDQQFALWSQLLEMRVGVRLGQHQRQFLQSQVGMRMRELGEESFSDYFHRVTDAPNAQLEWAILVDRLVVKETTFFRHKPSLNYVAHFLQDRINAQKLGSSFDIWSLGCSSGEEAYSLAMVTNESFELAQLEQQFSVTATDISRVAISLAKAATYPARKLEFVPASFKRKYFVEMADANYRFQHPVVSKMCFSCSNILNLDDMPSLDFDVVYCQNLLVYFQQSLRHKLLDSIVKKMKPGALLVIGLGEVTSWSNDQLQRIQRPEVQAYVKPVSNN
ncbi:CheR family methyltransferase [Agaribacterium haliotis]|uniref:CheR family methyltransferase n=1 Tax=Agaribacterium haliotis TaxID=2013869 RepID=UPI000BB59819|nr:protein-glutamate O-methyltransferase CheR [Agaribacterium haliotis]